MKRWLLVLFGLTFCGACIEGVDLDADETELGRPPTVEFDPGAGVIPFPNNLLLDPDTGTLDLPPQCGESQAGEQLRVNVLNQLDGFGTFMPLLRVTFSAPVDAASLENRVWLFQVQQGGEPNNPAAVQAVPTVTQLTQTPRFSQDCQSSTLVDTLIIVPAVPLADNSTYAVALLDGIESTDGRQFVASPTFLLTRTQENPVQIVEVAEDGSRVEVSRNQTPFDAETPEGAESIVGINRLWMFNNQFLPFVAAALGNQLDDSTADPLARDELLLAWAFNTQTVEEPLDPTASGSLAAGLDTATPNATTAVDLQPDVAAPQVVDAALCAAQGQEPGCGACNAVPCNAVGAVKAGVFQSPQYQVTQGGLLGAWNAPLSPELQRTGDLEYIAFFPAGTAPEGGWPVVIFGHGLGRSKEDLFAIAPQLAAAGTASISFDWVLHGSRAVQISDTGDCAGDPDPTVSPECFQPPLSPDLATVRDSIRQSTLDALKLVDVLQACSTGTDCGEGFNVDAEQVGYLGQSLGGIVGVIISGMSEAIDAAVLNTAGVDWIGIIVDSQTDAIRCGFIDGLILAGVLEGNLSTEQDPLCLTDDFVNDPAFNEFVSTARWVLDPAEPANFADRLTAADSPVLIQEVAGDEVVPNSATETLGNLLGLNVETAAVNTGTATPTPAVISSESAWLLYGSSEAEGQNEFSHGSLLRPVDSAAGALGTAQMQTDAITFLSVNLTQ